MCPIHTNTKWRPQARERERERLTYDEFGAHVLDECRLLTNERIEVREVRLLHLHSVGDRLQDLGHQHHGSSFVDRQRLDLHEALASNDGRTQEAKEEQARQHRVAWELALHCIFDLVQDEAQRAAPTATTKNTRQSASLAVLAHSQEATGGTPPPWS